MEFSAQNTGKPGGSPLLPNPDFAPGDARHGSSGTRSVRTVVFHYHLFKNAGTSVDEMLQRNFGAEWVAQEFPRQRNSAAVARFLSERRELVAVSSHTALLPVPRVEGVAVFPILFIRHPIDRLRSAYEFERTQAAETPGARLAKSSDLAGYIRELLKLPRNRQARNFQTFRLSHNEPVCRSSELERAIRALRSLPFIGLVEAYDESVEHLEKLLKSLLPRFRARIVHRNAAPTRQLELAQRLASVERCLGHTLYHELCAANQDDILLYELLRARYECHQRRGDPSA